MKKYVFRITIITLLSAFGSGAAAVDLDVAIDKPLSNAPAVDIQTWTGPTNPVVLSKTKVTCTSVYGEKITLKDGAISEVRHAGKTSESIRTTWKNNQTEYRFSEHTSYTDNGSREISHGRTTTKITQREENGLLIEDVTAHSVLQYLGGVSVDGGNLVERDSVTSTSYKVEDHKRTVVKSIVDGKEVLAGDVETLIPLPSTQQMFKVWSPAYVEDYDWGKVEVSELETSCLLETL